MVGTGGYDAAGEMLPSTEDIVHGDVITDFDDLEVDDGHDDSSDNEIEPDEDYF